MTATAGRKVRIKASGAAVAFTTEATTNAGDNLNYQITDTAKRVWDRSEAVTVYVDAVEADADTYTVNRLAGRITFGASQGAGVVTVTGSYLPMTAVAESKSFAISFKGDNGDGSDFEDDDVVRVRMVQDVSGRLGRWKTSAYFTDAIAAGTVFVLELFIDGAGTTPIAKVWAVLAEQAYSAAQRTLQEETVSFEGAADVDGRAFTFRV